MGRQVSGNVVSSGPSASSVLLFHVMAEYSLYKSFCDTQGVAHDGFLAKCFRSAERTGSLHVRGYTISEVDCSAIAWVVARSPGLVSLSLRDCLPPARGLAEVLAAASDNRSLIYLDLAGSNAATAVDSLARFVTDCSSVKTLILKWNNLGTNRELSILWRALKVNQHIEYLDLSNNQLDTTAAMELAKELNENTALKRLDLRWNQIEEIGASVFLDLVSNSSTLDQVRIEGNFVSPTATTQIVNCRKYKEGLKAVTSEYENRMEALVKHIKQSEESRVEQVKQLAIKSSQLIQAAERRASEGEAALASASAELETFRGRLERAETSTEAARLRIESLQNELAKEREKASATADHYRAETDRLTKDLCRLEAEYTSYRSEKERRAVAEKEARTAAESLASHHAAASEKLRSQVEQLRNEAQDTYIIQIEKLEAERGMWERRWREADESGAAMVQRLRAQSLDSQRALEQTILDLTQAQSHAVEAVTERLEATVKEKSALEEELASVQFAAASLRRENAELVVRATEPTKKAAALMQELAEEKLASEHKRQELEDMKRKAESARKDAIAAKEETARMTSEASTTVASLETRLKENDLEMTRLRAALTDKDAKIAAIRREEKERARSLISAVNDYVKDANRN